MAEFYSVWDGNELLVPLTTEATVKAYAKAHPDTIIRHGQPDPGLFGGETAGRCGISRSRGWLWMFVHGPRINEIIEILGEPARIVWASDTHAKLYYERREGV